LTASSVTPSTMGTVAVAALATTAGGGRACNDHRCRPPHQLCRHFRQAIVATFGNAIFDRDVAPVGVVARETSVWRPLDLATSWQVWLPGSLRAERTRSPRHAGACTFTRQDG
jgi:hypothetical protein